MRILQQLPDDFEQYSVGVPVYSNFEKEEVPCGCMISRDGLYSPEPQPSMVMAQLMACGWKMLKLCRVKYGNYAHVFTPGTPEILLEQAYWDGSECKSAIEVLPLWVETQIIATIASQYTPEINFFMESPDGVKVHFMVNCPIPGLVLSARRVASHIEPFFMSGTSYLTLPEKFQKITGIASELHHRTPASIVAEIYWDKTDEKEIRPDDVMGYFVELFKPTVNG